MPQHGIDQVVDGKAQPVLQGRLVGREVGALQQQRGGLRPLAAKRTGCGQAVRQGCIWLELLLVFGDGAVERAVPGQAADGNGAGRRGKMEAPELAVVEGENRQGRLRTVEAAQQGKQEERGGDDRPAALGNQLVLKGGQKAAGGCDQLGAAVCQAARCGVEDLPQLALPLTTRLTTAPGTRS